MQATHRSMVIADANCEAILTALQAPKMKRRMVRVLAPQVVVLDG